MPVADSLRLLRLQGHRTGLKCPKNTKQNKALQSLKRRSVGVPTFAKINSCTYRVDAPRKSGAGWLMEVAWPGGSRQRWVARVGSRASEALALDEAKRAAVTMLREGGKVEPWIADLNKIAAAEINRVALANDLQRWPRDLLGSSRRGSMQIDREQRNAILSAELFIPSAIAEPLSGDEHRLTYDASGNVELPACLDRRKPKPSATSQNSVTTKKPQQLALSGPRKQESDLQ